MRTKHSVGTIGVLLAVGVPALLAGCRPSPEDAAAQVPGVMNGDIHGDTTIAVRRVWESDEPDFYANEPSPDGRYMTEIDWTTGDLAIVDLLSGEQRRVTHKGDWTTSGDYAETAVFSPDGSRIAYVWFNCVEMPCGYEIRVSDVDGGNVRTVFAPELDPSAPRPYDAFYPTVFGWAGRELLAMVYRGRESEPRAELGLFSVDDGDFRSIVRFGQDVANHLLDWGQISLSPDGRFAAYGIWTEPGVDEDIVIVSTADGRTAGRLAGPATDRVVGFNPDGGGLYFMSDRELTQGLWNQPLRDGRPVGDPVLLRSDLWRTAPIGVSKSAIFYGVMTESEGVRVATFDPETGALLSEPVAVEPPSGGGTASPIWSPDGQHLAYSRINERESSFAIVIRSMAGDDVREIAVPQRLANLVAWTEEATILAIDKAQDTGLTTLFEVDLETGTMEELFHDRMEGPRPRFMLSGIGPAGPQVYYLRGNEASWALIGRDVGSGSERELLSDQSGSFQGIWPSPDGRTLAVMIGADGSDGVFTMSSGGGELREIHRGMHSNGAGIIWNSDSRRFFFLSWAGDPPTHTLWRGDAVTGDAVRMSEPGAAYRWGQPSLHPSGRRIAFEGGRSHGEVWMMTHLPGVR